MAMKVKATAGKEFDLAPAGTHVAVCVAVIDLGTHTEQFKGQPARDVHKLFLAWELPAEATHPVVGKDFAVSGHVKSNFRQWLKNWRGKDLADGEEFDPTALLGKKCQITVEHVKSGDKTFAKVAGLAGLARGMTVPDAQHSPVSYDMDSDKEPLFPEWMPYLYGETLEDWVARSHEKKGKPATPLPAETAGGAQQPQPAGTASSGEDNQVPW